MVTIVQINKGEKLKAIRYKDPKKPQSKINENYASICNLQGEKFHNW